jgi:hypothetical protein
MRSHNIRIPLILLTALVALWPSPLPGRSGQADLKTFRGEVTDSICAKTGSHDAMMVKMPSMGRYNETCAKQCAEIGGKYVLYDEANKAVYTLDDQAKAKTFAGRKVRVAGTLEGNNIRVKDVKAVG